MTASGIPKMVDGILYRANLTLEDTKTMTDKQLLELPNFGQACLSYVRQHLLIENQHLARDLLIANDALDCCRRERNRLAEIVRRSKPDPHLDTFLTYWIDNHADPHLRSVHPSVYPANTTDKGTSAQD